MKRKCLRFSDLDNFGRGKALLSLLWVRALDPHARHEGDSMMMRKILLAGAMLGLVMGVAAPMTARALTIGPAS